MAYKQVVLEDLKCGDSFKRVSGDSLFTKLDYRDAGGFICVEHNTPGTVHWLDFRCKVFPVDNEGNLISNEVPFGSIPEGQKFKSCGEVFFKVSGHPFINAINEDGDTSLYFCDDTLVIPLDS